MKNIQIHMDGVDIVIIVGITAIVIVLVVAMLTGNFS